MSGALPAGQYTVIVYTAIKEQRYLDAIDILQGELQSFPRSRAALSLLGYCYYHVGSYADAAQSYEELIKIVPDNEDYKIYYAQSLHHR
jgi:tetratricopeptide repeat protein 30